ncbi:MAG: RNA polymerase sigma-70 factor (ECF subfamily) [Candidatus Azotimanducaceae bacterium]|jgi:RNA polymerase sigma-70 factor (ECF subfamily)
MAAHRTKTNKTPATYLTTIVARLCIDVMRKSRPARVIYPGPWLPEPLSPEMTEPFCPSAFGEPEGNTRQAESISMAFLCLLETLSPLERAVFILKEAFDSEHTAIAEALEITPAHSRQTLRRAKGKIKTSDIDCPGKGETQRLMEQFMIAAATGNLEALHELMSEDITALSDGGRRASAALLPLRGKERVTTVFLFLMKKQTAPLVPAVKAANGNIALVLWQDDIIHSSHTLEIRAHEIYRVFSTRNPDKLHYL